MHIAKIKVVTKASHNHIKVEDGHLKVYVTVAPEKGKANKVVVELLAKHYGASKSAISIIQGETSANKKIAVTI